MPQETVPQESVPQERLPSIGRYVALGSSMAAGPGIRPRAAGSPRRAMRSARNYPHVIARRTGADLIDVTYSGATTTHLLSASQNGVPPQIQALDGTEDLVTVTVGGNDVGYVPLLVAATLPPAVRSLPVIRPKLRALLDPTAREHALERVAGSLREVGAAVRRGSPRARVVFVDYLTLLPPPDSADQPLPAEVAALARRVGSRLATLTAAAARETGCEIVAASHASLDHHPWSTDPWTTGPGLFLPWRPAPFHPTAAGMAAVAALVLARLTWAR